MPDAVQESPEFVQPGADHPDADKRVHEDISSELVRAGIISTREDVNPEADIPMIHDEAVPGVVNIFSKDLQDQYQGEVGRARVEPSGNWGEMLAKKVRQENPGQEVSKE